MKVNPFEDTPEEKNQKILDMLEEDYTYKDIMRDLHVSPSTISSAKKMKFGNTEDNGSNQVCQISNESQALKLFSEGRNPLQVAMTLDLATDYVFVIHERYQRLRNLESFNLAFEHVKGNISPFLRLFDLMKGLGMSPEQVADTVKYGNELPQLRNMHSTLSEEVHALESQKLMLSTQVNLMAPEVDKSLKSLEYYDKEIVNKKNELSYLNSEIKSKEGFIQNFDNDDGYLRIKEAAAKETKFLMQDNTVLLAYTVSATLEALRRYPYSEELFCDLLTCRDNSTTFSEQSPVSYHKSKLFKLAEQVQEEIAQQITNVTMSDIRARNDEPQTSSQMT